MHVLLTGAAGHLGRYTLKELLKQGHSVRCFMRTNRASQRYARMLQHMAMVEVVWGDIRTPADVDRAVAGTEVVLHMAALLPPYSDTHPTETRAINVGGTRLVLDAIQRQPQPSRLLYVSSIAVFGATQDQPPPRRVTDPVAPLDVYSETKVACEEFIRASPVPWSILRIAAIPYPDERFAPSRIRMMFALNPNDRIECIHIHDAALALANAVTCDAILGKTLLVAGGPHCQIYLRDYFNGPLEAAGIGVLPPEAYGTTPYHLDWYNTTESQTLLQYQQHSFADYVRELQARMFWQRRGVALVRPLVRRWLLVYSPFFRARP